MKLDNFGFEFTYRGRAIAAVSLLNNGRVWIKNDIPEDLKVVVAGVATSLMVRENLQETANNM